MNIKIYQVDAFTVKPFTGNPAGVCVLENPRDDAWMQAVAAEMNLPETAFLLPKGNGYNLRWFTPTIEVDLCGHATLASAHILYEFGYYEDHEIIEFFTRSGKLTSSFDNGFIELDMPRYPFTKIEPPAVLIDVLDEKPIAAASVDNRIILAEMENKESILNFVPDFKKLATLNYEEIVLTARYEHPKYDVISRFFAPRLGINEDPVTGSIHCMLGPYWSDKIGKDKFLAYQASPRGGEVRVRLTKDRAFIGGKAITVLRGDLVHQ